MILRLVEIDQPSTSQRHAMTSVASHNIAITETWGLRVALGWSDALDQGGSNPTCEIT